MSRERTTEEGVNIREFKGKVKRKEGTSVRIWFSAYWTTFPPYRQKEHTHVQSVP